MKKRRKKNLLKMLFVGLAKLLLFIVKIPYYFIIGCVDIVKEMSRIFKKKEVEKKRASMTADYQEIRVIKSEKGKFNSFENAVMNTDSKIGIIVGARGSGKTAFGLSFMENLYSKKKKKIFALGFKKEEMPSWIEVIDDVSWIKNNSFILVDEGGILFSSRKAMSNANKLLSELILIARHKSISVLFISQNSSNIDVNALRQADYLVLKKPSLLQKNFERRIIRDIYDKIENGFERYKNYKGLTYVYSDSFKGFVDNPLPSFWSIKISKSFSDR